jgi:hypothetical protein
MTQGEEEKICALGRMSRGMYAGAQVEARSE